MAVTRAEIANRVLRRCGVLAFGQAVDSNRTNAALQAYDEVYAYLDNLDIVDWGSTASVPDEYVFFVVALASKSLGSDLGMPAARKADINNDARTAELDIRRVFNNAYTPDDTKVVDF